MDEVKQQLKVYQYQIRGLIETESPAREKMQIADAEQETRAFISQLQERYPNGLGFMGGVLAVIDTVLNLEQV